MRLFFVFLSCMTFSDILAQSQNEINIGKQLWMTENLNVSTFRNGDTIFEAKSRADWVKAAKSKIPAYCYFKYNPDYGKEYGKLYNWYAVVDTRGLAPAGYHIPTIEEWDELIYTLGGLDIAGKSLKSIKGWNSGESGNNSSGFTALPGGDCNNSGFFVHEDGEAGYWWSSTEFSPTHAYFRSVSHKHSVIYQYINDKSFGFSVRCLKD